MLSWLHNFIPDATLFVWGPFTIRWYGLFVVLGIVAGFNLSLYLAKKFQKNSEHLWDLFFYLVLFGLVGARVYEIFLEWPYYRENLWQIPQIWQGGLAIHGALIAGVLTLLVWTIKHKENFWFWVAILSPGFSLGQALGRFGNWFNQELFGRPTNAPWGIPIEAAHRPELYQNAEFFHPTFLYESLGLICLTIVLVLLLKSQKDLSQKRSLLVVTVYLVGAALLRFFLEFIKIDKTPLILGWRWPQVFTLLIITIAIINYLFHYYRHEHLQS